MFLRCICRAASCRVALLSAALSLATAASAAASPDIVLYPTDVTTISGNWARVQSASGAGVTKMQSVDRGWSTTEQPLADPNDYFEVTFSAPSFTKYHVWLRLRATDESKWNDSVWVQFSDALDRSGNTIYPIGSGQALLANLTTCSSCPPARWGWQDGAYWLRQENIVQFPSTGQHRIRIQTREDGVQIDQIVLSPVRFFSSAPGPVASDGTVLEHSPNGDAVDAGASPAPAAPQPAPAAPAAPDTSASAAPSAPAPSAPQSDGGTPVAVVTWNVQVNDGSEAHARQVMARLASMSPQPQVIVIEEAHQALYNTYIDELQSRTGRSWSGVMLTHCALGGWNGSTCTAPRDEGVAVFSSFRVVDKSSRWLPYADGYHSARAAVRLGIDVNGTVVQVFGVHLQVGSAAARNSSMALLKSWAGGYSAPQLVAGDFNADMDQIDTSSGMSPQFVDSWAQRGGGSGFTANTPSPTMKLDYWFADASGRATVDWVNVNTSTGTLSDHFPVAASYTIH